MVVRECRDLQSVFQFKLISHVSNLSQFYIPLTIISSSSLNWERTCKTRAKSQVMSSVSVHFVLLFSPLLILACVYYFLYFILYFVFSSSINVRDLQLLFFFSSFLSSSSSLSSFHFRLCFFLLFFFFFFFSFLFSSSSLHVLFSPYTIREGDERSEWGRNGGWPWEGGEKGRGPSRWVGHRTGRKTPPDRQATDPRRRRLLVPFSGDAFPVPILVNPFFFLWVSFNLGTYTFLGGFWFNFGVDFLDKPVDVVGKFWVQEKKKKFCFGWSGVCVQWSGVCVCREVGWVCSEVGCEFWWFLFLVGLVGSAGRLEKNSGLLWISVDGPVEYIWMLVIFLADFWVYSVSTEWVFLFCGS